MPFEKLFTLFTRSLDHCILFRFIFFHLSYILRHIFTLFTHFTNTIAGFHILEPTRNIFFFLSLILLLTGESLEYISFIFLTFIVLIQ